MNTETSHTKTEQQLVPQLRFPEFRGEWTRNKLKDVSQYFNGGSFESDVKESGKYELITLKSIDTLGNLVSSKRYIDTEVKTLTKDTLVMILSEQAPGLLGMTALIPQNNKYVLNQRIAEIRPNQKIDSYFLSMAINRNQRYFSKMGAGMKVQNISKPNVENYKFFSTEFPEQQKIAGFLTAVDTKIQQLTQKKELLEQYKKGVMQQLFSQRLRFKIKNEVGELVEPPDWEEKKLGDLDILISDGNYGELYPKASEMKESGVPFIRANNIKGLKLVWNDMKYIDKELHSILTSGHLRTNDILVTTRGDIGMVAFVNEEFNGANINAQICLLRSGKNINANFLLQVLGSKKGKSQFRKLQTGSALKQLPKSSLKSMKLIMPSLKEQQKIANYLSALDNKIESVSQQITQTQQFKKGLLQQMFV